MQISIKDNLQAARRSLLLDQKQFGREIPRALNFTAAETRKVLRSEMERVFDRPTPFTLNGMFVQSATEADLSAAVFFKDFAPKGTPAGKYLRAQIEGGSRRQKRSERAFAAAGLSGNRGFWVPGSSLKLNAYGNVPGSVMVQILAAVRAFGEVGYVANKTANSAKRNKSYRARDYFVIPPGHRLKPGVWVRVGRDIWPVLLFVEAVSYRKRFDFFGKGETFARSRFEIEIENAVRRTFRHQSGR
ncbi:hypothetical protein SAMN02745157_0687 [Kaistia soli DSM 19436]|uniref:Uncharacterized protein n=1 Tax=Kaistia soli DSM 19436 TaxID=1122133 RepID=A0A1M4VES7_9HYPH|nr:hypothetical protein [Kaistia soli]SHE67504.1 hypothetical protein SAMN02745157_0687 [Kaistia soli DSM 19436]